LLDESETPIRQFAHMTLGVTGVDSASIFALRVAKVERVTNPPTNKAPARDAAAGIAPGNAPAALNKMEVRLAADDTVVGGAAYEHREPIEVLHKASAACSAEQSTHRLPPAAFVRQPGRD